MIMKDLKFLDWQLSSGMRIDVLEEYLVVLFPEYALPEYELLLCFDHWFLYVWIPLYCFVFCHRQVLAA